jgi:hypothetical protein
MVVYRLAAIASTRGVARSVNPSAVLDEQGSGVECDKPQNATVGVGGWRFAKAL